MNNPNPVAAEKLNEETIEHLRDLVRGLLDSVKCHTEAAQSVDDANVAALFRELASQRQGIANTLDGYIVLAHERPVEEASWLGKLRACWTSFRAGLSSGDATTMLVEAERAEDAIVQKFQSILPKVAGNPINEELLAYFDKVKAGHDRVLEMRNAYQNT